MSAQFIIHLNKGKQFAAAPGTPLLDAALSAGLVLEHSCRSGRCGSCKTQALSGQVQHLGGEDCLTAQERAAGWLLSCCDGALSDVHLDAEDLSALAGLKPRTLPARISALTPVSDSVLHVQLRLPPQQHLHYLSGQTIKLIAAGTRRSYSIANAPRADGSLDLYVKRSEQGVMSSYLFERAKLNDLVRIDGPHGSFFLRDVAGQDLVLLATGTGIAPLVAMLQALPARPAAQQPRRVQLFWGVRRASELFLKPPCDYHPVLSRSGPRQYVQDAYLASQPRLSQAQVYACGSAAMIASARQSLLAAGLAAGQFYADAFVPSDPQGTP